MTTFMTDDQARNSKVEDMRNWTFNKIENSDDDRDSIVKEFVSKFGKSNLEVYETAEAEILD